MLTRVTAVEYVRPMESGRTSPLLVRCSRDDGSIIEVVVKFSGFCDQREENLAMELVAACLAGDLKLPIPEPMLVVIPTEWAAIVPDDELRKRVQASSPIAFGSRLVTGGYSIWTPDTRLMEAMVDTAAGVFAFDAIIQNPEPFKPHFLVGAPTDTRLTGAYQTAKEILRRAPNSPEIFEEGEIDELVAQIEDEMRTHIATE
jgi:hypothetical protein